MLTMRVWLGLAAWLVVTAAVCYLVAPRSNAGFADDAAVLSFATLVAIGIERVLELMWSFASQSQKAGGWWPLKPVTDAIDSVLNETNAFLSGHVDNTLKALSAAKVTIAKTEAERKKFDDAAAEIEKQRDALKTKLTAAEKLAPGSERLALIAAISTEMSSQLKNALEFADDLSGEAAKGIKKADETVDFALTIVGSFSDNPARRVASILIGGGLGIMVAGFVGLNIFSAVLGEEAGYFAAGVGVVLTGFIVGLGSSPTHEVIKALQNYKSSRGTMVASASISSGKSEEQPQIIRGDGQRVMAAAAGGVGAPQRKQVLLRGTQ